MKKVITLVLLVVMLWPGSMFHSAVIALILVLMWRRRIKDWVVPKWKYGYKAVVGVLSVLTLLLMPRPFALPWDRVRYVPLNEDYSRVSPSLAEWVAEVIVPEETACAVGMLVPFSPFRHMLPLGESILKDFDYEMSHLRLHRFMSPYNSLAHSLESPMSGAYHQGFNQVLHTPNAGRNIYVIRPRHYNPDKEYPVVFFAHGYLGNWKLYTGMLKDLDDKIVVCMGTKDLSGIFTRSDIGAIFSHYIPMLEKDGYKVDMNELSIIGLSNGGSAVDAAYANYGNRFKNIVYVSTGVNVFKPTTAKVIVIGGGRDHCGPSMRNGIRRFKGNGQKRAEFFDEYGTHFIMVTERDRVMDFLKEEL